jgi:hypothetical protein
LGYVTLCAALAAQFASTDSVPGRPSRRVRLGTPRYPLLRHHADAASRAWRRARARTPEPELAMDLLPVHAVPRFGSDDTRKSRSLLTAW